MSRYQSYTIFFLFCLLMGIAVVNVNLADADPKEIAELRDEINSLEWELHDLEASLAKAEADKADAAVHLDFLDDRIGKVSRQIAGAYEGLMAAENDAQREAWNDLITDLQKRLEFLEADYCCTTYTIYMLGLDIETLNDEIDAVEESLAVANARLAELLD